MPQIGNWSVSYLQLALNCLKWLKTCWIDRVFVAEHLIVAQNWMYWLWPGGEPKSFFLRICKLLLTRRNLMLEVSVVKLVYTTDLIIYCKMFFMGSLCVQKKHLLHVSVTGLCPKCFLFFTIKLKAKDLQEGTISCCKTWWNEPLNIIQQSLVCSINESRVATTQYTNVLRVFSQFFFGTLKDKLQQ